MKILAMEKERQGVRSEEFKPHLESEARSVYELYKTGVLREIYFRKDKPEAVLMLECRDEKEASDILAGLPLVRQRLIDFDIVPLVPYPGFARLFREEK